MRLMKLISEETVAKEPLLILDKRGWHVRVGGAWHHGLMREESRRALLDAGIAITCFQPNANIRAASPIGNNISSTRIRNAASRKTSSPGCWPMPGSRCSATKCTAKRFVPDFHQRAAASNGA